MPLVITKFDKGTDLIDKEDPAYIDPKHEEAVKHIVGVPDSDLESMLWTYSVTEEQLTRISETTGVPLSADFSKCELFLEHNFY